MSIASDIVLTKSFTSQQRAFVDHLSEGLEPGRSAELAGYAPEHASSIAWQLMRQPAIIASVHLETARKLSLAAPAALKFLQDTVRDDTVDKRLRAAIAKTLLDRAGHIAPKAAAAWQGVETPLNEMSMHELRTLADKLEGEIAGRAKEVSSAKPAPKASQAIDDII